jgi:hypothetical protein
MWTISTSLAGSCGFSNLFQGFVTASLVVEVALRAIVQGQCRCLLIRCKQPGLKLSSSPGSCFVERGHFLRATDAFEKNRLRNQKTKYWHLVHLGPTFDKLIDMKSKDGRVEIDII